MARWIPSPNFLPGSTDVGSVTTDTHKFTGSVNITGSLTLNGSAITAGGGGGAAGIAMEGSTANGVLTRKNSTTASVEANFRFDGSRFDATGSSFLSGNLTQGGGEGLNSDFYEGSGQVALSYAGQNLDDPEAGSQYHFFIDKGADNDLPEINIGTIDGEQRPGDGSSTINIGTSGSSVTINGGEAGTGANPITIGNDYSAVVVGQLTGTYAWIAGNTVGADGPATLEIGTDGDSFNNLGKITINDGNNATGSAIIWNSSGSEGLILSSSRDVTIYPGLTVTGDVTASSNISASSFYGGSLTTTGNTILGNAPADNHQVTGTLNVLGDVSASLSLSSSGFWADGVTIRDGFIGVGTSMPPYDQDAIHLKSTSGNPVITIEAVGAAKNPIYQLKTNNSADLVEMYIDNDGTNNPFYIRRGGGEPPSLAIFDNNNIRIGGTGSPSIQVSGTLHVSGGIIQQQYFSASISSPVNATCSLYNVFNYHLTANSEVTASGPVAGTSYLFFFRQDGTGARTVSFSGFKWPGGTAPTLSTAAGAVDIVSGISDGTNIYADTTKAFS